MILISHINKLFILLLLSIGVTSISHAALFDGWSDNQLCEWMDQPSPPRIIESLVNQRKISCSEGIAKNKPVKPLEPVKKVGEAANAFDGAYAFIIRTEPDDGEKNIGTAQLIIKDGKISVARKYRYLLTSSTISYDTFEGVIDKEGNINASFELNPIRHMVEPKTIKFSGSMESLQLHGRFDEIMFWDNETKKYVVDENFYTSFYDVIIDFKKENY